MAGLLLPLAASNPTLTEAQKIKIIRTLIAEVGIARRPLPTDKKGIEITPDGRVLDPDDVQASLNEHGRAATVGDRVSITAIDFQDDRIVFAINGGPLKTHWYDHLQIGMGNTTQPVSRAQTGPAGAQITLRFEHGVPALTPEAVKQDLGSLIDWDPPSKAQVMVKALPAPVKSAIDAHHVLVGMNTDMVVAALGRTGNKDREADPASGATYEDWIYGNPPAVQMVRIENDRVIRVTTYKADGSQTVDTTPDPALVETETAATTRTGAKPEAREADAPTLRRPGDTPPANDGARPTAQAPPPPRNGGVVPGNDGTQTNGIPGGLPGARPGDQGLPNSVPPPIIGPGVTPASSPDPMPGGSPGQLPGQPGAPPSCCG